MSGKKIKWNCKILHHKYTLGLTFQRSYNQKYFSSLIFFSMKKFTPESYLLAGLWQLLSLFCSIISNADRRFVNNAEIFEK